MRGHSSPVSSDQRHCHPRLGKLVSRHLGNEHRRPIAAHTRAAFEAIRHTVEQRAAPLVFDSFCGTGMSTALLAQRHPDCLIIGIDKSAHRINKHSATAPPDYLLVRADCGDFWRLALAAGWALQWHYLFYPNPWPKQSQLQRRLHGSPEFSSLLALGGWVELRSNWQVYVEEFGSALHLAGHPAWVDSPEVGVPVSLFERKYLHSGHPLWRCRCKLNDSARLAGGGLIGGAQHVQD
ncbi:MAG: SAM-dependent methyltransferase [Gammaproteobacteria bacterium]|nr:SAM-dependent methyltransferase [Gammaproteobacteria bacterium]